MTTKDFQSELERREDADCRDLYQHLEAAQARITELRRRHHITVQRRAPTRDHGGCARPEESRKASQGRRKNSPWLSRSMKRSGTSAARPEREIAAELRQIALLGTRLTDEQLGLSVRQGECLMEAADYIKVAGGIEQWLAKHGIDLGISGKSRSTAAKLLKLGRAGLKKCQAAVEFVAKHPERLNDHPASRGRFLCRRATRLE